MITRGLGFLGFVGLLGAIAACATGTNNGNDMPGPGDLGNADGGGLGNGLDGGGGCSSDLHDVLDPSGNVVMHCPDDQACADGKCIGSCLAAAANHGNVACDFILGTPEFDVATMQPCWAAFISNNWQKPVQIKVSWDGQPLDATQFTRVPNGNPDPTSWPTLGAGGLPPGQVGVLFLSHDPFSMNGGNNLACKVAPAFSHATELYQSGRSKTFHIETDYPVSTYDIMPFGGAKSFLPGATMILPTTAWGKNYVATFPYIYVVKFLGSRGGPITLQIAAAQDATTVKLLPKDDMQGAMNVPAAPKNQTTSLTLGKGEMIQWNIWSDDISGTVIESDKPVSVVTGSAELCLSSKTSPDGGGCDSAHQQIMPVSALGQAYAIAPFATRRADLQDESIPYRIVGAVDGTSLVFDPPIAGAPSSLASGQKADFEAIGPFHVTSQDKNHPFFVAQNMPGGLVTGGSRPGWTVDIGNNGLGDEEFLAVLPPQQWQSKYVFFTDPTYGTTNIVVTRMAGKNGFDDVTVDCLGTISGWKPIGGNGQYQFTNVDMLRGGNGACKNGQHTAESKGRFGLVVWGLDTWSSYGYPAGGSVAPINDVVVPTTPR
jgi:hypothetical protein